MFLADGFESAFLGTVERKGEVLAVYSVDACLSVLRERDGMTDEEALDHFFYNVHGAWIGEGTPLWLFEKTLEQAELEAELAGV